jgi:hypothetical protein
VNGYLKKPPPQALCPLCSEKPLTCARNSPSPTLNSGKCWRIWLLGPGLVVHDSHLLDDAEDTTLATDAWRQDSETHAHSRLLRLLAPW